MNRKTVAFIKKSLRKASLANPARNEVKKRAKVDKSLYACQNDGCTVLVYEGYSDKNFREFQQKYVNSPIKKGKVELDHLEMVVDFDGFKDWNTYIERLFCDEDKYQVLCSSCHADRTRKQNKQRAKKK